MQYELALFNAVDLEALPSTMNSEVAAIVHQAEVDLESKSFRRDLRVQFLTLFNNSGWKTDTNLYFEPARTGTPHFTKNRILVQISWRHYEKIGTELLKFQKDFQEGHIDAGVYICITDKLRNSLRKTPGVKKGPETFEGSTTMEKATQYMESVKSIIKVPIAVMGLLPPQ